MRQKGGEGVPGLCLPAQQDPKSRGEGHDILWPSQTGGQSPSVAALVPGHVTGCDTSTAATDIPVWLRSGQPQKGTEQQSPCSSVKPRAARWALPSTNSFLGAPLSRGRAQGSSHFHSSRPVEQGDNTPVDFQGCSCPLGIPAQPGQEQEQEQDQSSSGHVAGDSPEGVEQSRLHARLQQEQVDVHLLRVLEVPPELCVDLLACPLWVAGHCLDVDL